MERVNRLSRRRFLRGAFVGGSGLLAAYLVGCGGDEESGGEQTASPATDTATRTAGATVAPTATAGVLRWHRLEMSSGLPHARTDHSLVTDGRALLLFGGRTSGAPLGDLWSYDLASGEWAQLADGPPDRFGHNAVYDPAAGRMLVFGGQAGGSFFDDVWGFDGSTWTEVAADPRPAQRYGAASALDAKGRLVVSHGFTNQGRFDDTWAFAAAGPWADVSPGAVRPVKRCLCRGVWDGKRDRFLMFGGQTDGTPFLGDLWALDANGWTEITSEPKPSPRNFYAMVAIDSAMTVLFGGNTGDEPGPMNDLWFLDTANDTWTQVTPEGEAPSPRYGHDAVWLPDSRKLIVFGGHDASGDVSDLWELMVPG